MARVHNGRGLAAAALTVAALALGACSGAGSSASPSASPGGTAAQADTSTTAAALDNAYTSVVKAVGPSVVLIESASGLGSGEVYDTKGDIVTNAHVVGTETTFTVTFQDGRRMPATLVGSFPPDDLAVIKVNGTGLKPVTWGDSSKLQVGQPALAEFHPEWCEDDPVIHFSDGTSVHLVTSFNAAELTSSTIVNYDVHVPAGTGATVTKPRSGSVASQVTVTAGSVAGVALITVTVSGGVDATFGITVTQTGAGAGRHISSGSSSSTGTPISVTLRG